MEAWVSVGGEGVAARDVAIRTRPEQDALEVVAALAAHLGLPDAPRGTYWAMYSHRLATWFSPGRAFSTLDVIDGDCFTVGPRAGDPRAGAGELAALELYCVGGPSAGRVWELGDGEYLIGADSAAQVRLDDAFVRGGHGRLSVSGARIVLTSVEAGGVTLLDGQALVGATAVKPGQRITVGGSVLEARRRGDPAGSTTVVFNRPPRVLASPVGGVRRLEVPDLARSAHRVPIAGMLAPLVAGAFTFALFHSTLTLAFLALSPLFAIGSYGEGWLRARADRRGQARRFLEELGRVLSDLAADLAIETAWRRSATPGLPGVATMVHARDSRTWERRPGDPDFAVVRVGTADLPALHRVELGDGGDPALRARADAAMGPLDVVRAVPVMVNLQEAGVTGVCGPAPAATAIVRWMLVQTAAFHSPADLSFCALVPPEQEPQWDWMKWLPHTRAALTGAPGLALCSETRTAAEALRALDSLINSRLADVSSHRGAHRKVPQLLVLLHEDLRLPRAMFARLVADGPRAGLLVLWVGSTPSDLPGECGVVVEAGPGDRVSVVNMASGAALDRDAAADRASVAEARQVAMELAPLRDVGGPSPAAAIPRRVTLLDALGLLDSSPDAIIKRWRCADPGLVAPLGAARGGGFGLDLRADGPHALVAGTTGAGKSELLRSMVAGLAASYPPERLNLLLVDYKGGSAFHEAANLPHSVGVVTDLDGHLAERVLISLRAELTRREALLRDAGAQDLADLDRRGVTPPASLVVVIDEFATLVREVPGFVDGVVDLAQRGRSLGLHLVLATQRPAGVVTDNIRANTNLRIALRVADEADSIDVLDAPDAARLSRAQPGRAFARTGYRELTEFQVAFGGGAADGADADEVRVGPLGFSGPAWPAAARPHDPGRGTDLERLVNAVTAAHLAAGGVPPPRPWLPELPELVPVSRLPMPPARCLGVALGLMDIPQRQRQEPWIFDLRRHGNLMVLGSPGSGRTSVVRTIAASLARQNAPDRLHIYAIDGGGGLSALTLLPHVGGVIRTDEAERLQRLLHRVRALIDAQADASESPGIFETVVLVDNYTALAAAMQALDFGESAAAFARLVAEGPRAGVRFVVTADRRAAVPGVLWSAVTSRLVLGMADHEEYRNAGIERAALRGTAVRPGRGFLVPGLEVQCAVLGADGSPDGQVAEITAVGAAAVRPGDGLGAPRIGTLPDRLPLDELEPAGIPLTGAIGVIHSDLSPALVDLRHSGLVVAGAPRSGRSTAMATIAAALRTTTPGLETVLLAARRTSPLLEQGMWATMAAGVEGCSRLAAELAAGRSRRSDRPLLLLVDDGEELGEGPAASALEALVRSGRDGNVRVVAALEARAAHRAYSGWIPELRRERQALLLQPDEDVDGDLVAARLPRRRDVKFIPGRGYLVGGGRVELVQVATPAAATCHVVSAVAAG